MEQTGVTVRPRDGVLYRELDGGAVLLDVVTGAYFSLNATGAALWQLLPDTRDGIVDAARQQLVDTPADLATRVDVYLAALAERGLVEHDAGENLGGGPPVDGTATQP